ncbi:hypothetical protein [Longilinea arvoryzae]|uniref:hypothetical protein n=1 Tax=Longilinea arvoryzae TaxID=360412 RepID=UPI00126034FB|nr:hypothetical protein [Longilinea arvoryzae]
MKNRMMYYKNKEFRSPEVRVLEAYNYYLHAYNGKEPSFDIIGKRAGVSPRMVPDYLRALQTIKRNQLESSKNFLKKKNDIDI